MEYELRLFADCRCELSESPMWHKNQGCLYWRGFHGSLWLHDGGVFMIEGIAKGAEEFFGKL